LTRKPTYTASHPIPSHPLQPKSADPLSRHHEEEERKKKEAAAGKGDAITVHHESRSSSSKDAHGDGHSSKAGHPSHSHVGGYGGRKDDPHEKDTDVGGRTEGA
jgi:hypothetical protein